MTRKHRMAASVVAAALGLLASASASAETERGFYFGIAGGLATIDLPSREEFDEIFITNLVNQINGLGGTVLSAESSLDDSDTAWGLQVGYRFNRYIAAELGYVNLGEALYEAVAMISDGVETFPLETSFRYVSSGPTAAVLGILPISERFDVHGKAGIYFADTRVRARVRDIEFDENIFHDEVDAGEQEVLLGVGGAWNINDRYSVRFEYQRFMDIGDDVTGEADIDMLAVSILFR